MSTQPTAPALGLIHNRAVKLAGVLKALAHLVNEGECREGQDALVFVAEDMAETLERDLDALNSA